MERTDAPPRSLTPLTSEASDNVPSLSIEAPSRTSTNSTLSPNRISASFFSPIDPFLPRRHRTYNTTPQYVFPSALNDLPPYRSTPYAFNHHTLSFYWTRNDALVDATWNIWGRPPCLNCVVACGGNKDGDLARWCDFGERRDSTFGRVQACARCLRTGEDGACVEQIEVRRDGTVSAKEEDLQKVGTGRGMWSAREKKLRRDGVVEWRPINLHLGDVEGKRRVFEMWEYQQENRTVAGFRENWVLPAKLTLCPEPSRQQVRKTRAELDRKREQDVKAEKTRREKASTRVWEWDQEDVLFGRNETSAVQVDTAGDVLTSSPEETTRGGAGGSNEEEKLQELHDLKDMVTSMLRERIAGGPPDEETF